MKVSIKTKQTILGRLAKVSGMSPRMTCSEVNRRLEKINERTVVHTACAVAVEFGYAEHRLAAAGY